MNLVNLEKVSKRYAEKLVLDEVAFGVAAGERVALIGRNGAGKSTLLSIIAGEEEADQGRVVHAGDALVASSHQEPDFRPGATLIELVSRPRGTQVPAGEYDARARGLLHHLGLGEFERPVAELSGGQRKRVALAEALLRGDVAADEGRPVLLLLDEPTNHLDVDAIEWLEGRLRGWRGGLLLVTHDRHLLDRVATRVVELHRGRLFEHGSSYAEYLEGRTQREEQAEAAELRRRNLARTELAWLRRGPKARASKAKYRVERAEAMQQVLPDERQSDVEIGLPSRRIGSKVLTMHSVGKRYGDRRVLSGVDLKLGPGDRIGLVGPNGSGKSTLLRLVAGLEEPEEGKVSWGQTVHVGYFGQEPEHLPPGLRVIDAVKEVVLETNTIDGINLSASGLLERFLFSVEAQRAFVGELSGGERRRLQLLRVLADAPNLLVLDEPTNDLDLDTLAVLEDFLDGWPGVLVVASHDRFFLDRLSLDLHRIQPAGTLRHLPGGWQEYHEQRQTEEPVQRSGPARKPAGRPRPVPRRKRSYHEQREFDQLERRLPELAARREALERRVQAAGDDYEEAAEAGAELADVLGEIDAAETRWLELAAIGEEE